MHVRLSGHETPRREPRSEPAGPGRTERASRCRPSAPQAWRLCSAVPPARYQPRCRPGARSRKRPKGAVHVRARLIDQLDPSQSSMRGAGESELPTPREADVRPREGGRRPATPRRAPGSARSASSCRPSARPRASQDWRLTASRNSAKPTAMHEFADEQSTALQVASPRHRRTVSASTVHAADAAEGVTDSAAVASKIRRTDRSDICR